ncbi:MAG: glycine cleavage system protein GcvH [Gammaproteobacteria bacterium]|nr:MAG: glycine cleavage system protein GcvH [Gammaproteobacteria bacterium]
MTERGTEQGTEQGSEQRPGGRIPEELRYTRTHEWVRQEEDGSLTVGITDHAQALLGDLVYVELPEPGREVEAGEACAVVESVKAASDVYAPVSGEVSEVNEELADAPERVNEDPYGAGWMFRLRPADPAELEGLLDAAAYAELIRQEEAEQGQAEGG